MSASRARKVVLPSLVVAWAASCAVFPDEAVLPLTSNGEAGAAGDVSVAHAGAGDVGPAGVSGQGGVGPASLGGESGAAGAASLAGAAAGGASSECATPLQVTALLEADTWIESAKPATNHRADSSLSVVRGAEERRALLSFALPEVPVGAVLVRAALTLQLESNADVTLAERHLEMSLLGQGFDEARATWNNWGNGANRKWLEPGGDFGLALAAALIPASLSTGTVTFDVTDALADLLSTEPVPFPLIVRDVGPTPTSPAELAFTSREGDASGVPPELLIEYCP